VYFVLYVHTLHSYDLFDSFVLDGYPVKKIQIDYMEQRNIIPVQVIELEISGTDCADRATADRYSKDR